MRERLVDRTLNPLLHDLPDKFTAIRPEQIDAITEIVAAFDDGAQVVVLDAPTGSGKTLIAETVRRMLKVDGSYVCHSKGLQDQFSSEFGFPALYGRANYIPVRAGEFPFEVTCEDCSGEDCDLCRGGLCPYREAKSASELAEVAVVNSALWLSAMSNPGHWLGRRGLTVFDEADTLEGVLMGQAEIVVCPRAQERYGIDPPEKLTVEDSYGEWAAETLVALERAKKKIRARTGDVKKARERKRIVGLIANVKTLINDLEEGQPWVYTGGAGSEKRAGEYISFKPVTVSSLGTTRIWEHSPRFLLMSGTVISPGMMLKALGWDGPHTECYLDSTFPARNRPIIVHPTADMTRSRRTPDDDLALLNELDTILERHPGDRVLIHTVSYALSRQVAAELSASSGRAVYTYDSSGGKEVALAGFLRTDESVLVAPSLDRGVDLYDDRCRVQVICKVPFPNLGDKQVERRLYGTGRDGKVWYNVEVARSVQQMVGRGVRHKDDWCTTYVLDSHFVQWRRQWGHLFPKWFNRAIRVE